MSKKTTQIGRSMIEMLGVLAVMGVLSIVGISWYKRAVLKYQANELMNLLTMVYNQAQLKAMMGPQDQVVGNLSGSTAKNALRYKFRLYLTESSHAGSTNPEIGNMGMEPPTFINHPDFNIYINLTPSDAKSYADQTYYRFYFYGLNGNCDLCNELKSFTKFKKNAAYRDLPWPKQDKIAEWILYCYPTDGSDATTSCWKATETEE